MTNHLIVSFFYLLGSSCNVLVLHIVFIIVILVLLIIILILIIALRRLRSSAGKLYSLASSFIMYFSWVHADVTDNKVNERNN